MIEQDDVVYIGMMPDGHTAFFTKNGFCACSCGWQDTDKDYVYERATKSL